MIKLFDNSKEMMQDVMYIDSKSFKDIDCDIDTLCKRIKNNNQYELFVKYDNNVPVAYLGILYVANLHYDGAWIDLIAVSEDFRNKGIGTKLVEFAEKRVKEKGKNIITGLIKKENISSITMVKHRNFEYDTTGFFLFLKDL